jgi:hypothetical protein
LEVFLLSLEVKSDQVLSQIELMELLLARTFPARGPLTAKKHIIGGLWLPLNNSREIPFARQQ